MNTEDAKYLVEKFLDGETSVKEELCLRDFFKSNRRRLPSMSQELRIAAVMMDELEAMCPAPVRRLAAGADSVMGGGCGRSRGGVYGCLAYDI